MGYIIDRKDYDSKNLFKAEFTNRINFTKVSDLNLSEKNKYTVLIIGDSFSEQSSFGYKNYLGVNTAISVLYLDNKFYDNPISTLYGLLNGNLFDSLKIDYVILESIERTIAHRAANTDTNSQIQINQLEIPQIQPATIGKKKIALFNNGLISFPLINLKYYFDDNAFDGKVYKVKTTEKLFSVDRNELLFYDQDVNSLWMNSDIGYVETLNIHLNNLSHKLSKRGSKLLALPAPDKYDLYFDYLLPKGVYPKPLFFEHLRGLNKEYLFLDAKKILDQEISKTKDLYYYDDTHWTPNASKIIATHLATIINDDRMMRSN